MSFPKDDPEKLLKQEVQAIRNRNTSYKDDHAFTFWWINSQYLDDDMETREAVTGAPKDKNIDGLWVDRENHSVHIVQVKFRQKWGKNHEKRNDLEALINLLQVFWDKKYEKN